MKTWMILIAALALLVGTGCNLAPDPPADDDDDAGDDDAGDDDAADGSIYAIQQGEVADGEYVTLVDVVVTSPEMDEGFFVQDPQGGAYSGLYIFSYEDVLAQVDMARGQEITVSGTVTEFYDMTELQVTSADNIELTGTGTEPPAEVMSAADLIADYEPWESVPVEISGTVTAGADSYGQWAVDGVLVDDNFFHFEPNLGGTANKVAGPLFYEYDQFKILPRDKNDVDVEGGAGPEVVTIGDIRQGNVTENSVVKIEGAVVTTPLTEPYSSCEIQGFYIADPAGGEYSGINVIFWLDTVSTPTLSVGDEVDITGLYQESFTMSNLILQDAGNLTVTGAGAAPAPLVVADPCAVGDWEPYEGVVTQVQNLTVTGTLADIGFGSFEVNGCLLVDTKFFEYTDCGSVDEQPDPPMSQAITSITGPIKYTYDEWRIDPTGPSAFDGWTP